MIKTENITINGKVFIRTYSDSGRYVIRDNISYSEAIDPIEFNRVYIEGELIADEEEKEEASAAQIVDILLGEDND